MTRDEKETLRKIKEQIDSPTVTAVTYESVNGVTKRIENPDTKRLLESADYRVGWNACAEIVITWIDSLLSGKTYAQQIRDARKQDKKEQRAYNRARKAAGKKE